MGKPVGADKTRRSKTPRQVFGRAVTEMRIARNLSQIALASELGYSITYLGQIEQGKANVTLDVIAAVSSFFKLSIGQFWVHAEALAAKPPKKK